MSCVYIYIYIYIYIIFHYHVAKLTTISIKSIFHTFKLIIVNMN